MTTELADGISCVAASEGSSMVGTVDHVDGWLLLEAPGRWGAQWYDAEAVDKPLRERVEALLEAASAAGLKLRPQLIKQSAVRGQRVLLLAREQLWVLSKGWQGLLQRSASDALALFVDARDTPAAAGVTAAGQLQRLPEPQYFVCTNGQRDRCCGALGVPLYRQLSAAVQQRAWQISHVGGHRFAPNVLVTPGALLYGRVGASEVDRFLAAIETGELAFDWLRGRSSYPPLVQAAEVFIRRQGLRLLHVDVPEGSAGAAGTEPASGRVTFADGAARIEISVERSTQVEAVLASCGATSLKAYSPFATRLS